MDELWGRIALVGAALLTAMVIAWLLTRRGRSPVRDISTGDLAPGVYFFSSQTCPTCGRAREMLDRALGREAYTEMPWEGEPVTFRDLGVDAVPAVLIVGDGGEGRLFPGQPDRALTEL